MVFEGGIVVVYFLYLVDVVGVVEGFVFFYCVVGVDLF